MVPHFLEQVFRPTLAYALNDVPQIGQICSTRLSRPRTPLAKALEHRPEQNRFGSLGRRTLNVSPQGQVLTSRRGSGFGLGRGTTPASSGSWYVSRSAARLKMLHPKWVRRRLWMVSGPPRDIGMMWSGDGPFGFLRPLAFSDTRFPQIWHVPRSRLMSSASVVPSEATAALLARSLPRR